MTSLQSLTTSLVLAGAVLLSPVSAQEKVAALDPSVGSTARHVQNTVQQVLDKKYSLDWLPKENLQYLIPQDLCLDDPKKQNSIAAKADCKSKQPERQFWIYQPPYDNTIGDLRQRQEWGKFVKDIVNRATGWLVTVPEQTRYNDMAPVIPVSWMEIGWRFDSPALMPWQINGWIVTLTKKF